MDVRLAGLDVRAVSVAGVGTCIAVPSWRTCFDIGRCPPFAVSSRRVCFTHAHVDHMGGFIHHVSLRELNGQPAAEYWVPAPYVSGFRALLDGWRALDGGALAADVRSVDAGSVVDVGAGRRIHCFRSFHRIPTVGYALEATRWRLRPEFDGRPREEIAAARGRGETVSQEDVEIELAFCGDTVADVLVHEPLLARAKVLVLECSFLDERVSPDRARALGHVHLDHLVALADRIVSPAVLLTHFSARYGRDQILWALDKKLPAELRARVTPLLPSTGEGDLGA